MVRIAASSTLTPITRLSSRAQRGILWFVRHLPLNGSCILRLLVITAFHMPHTKRFLKLCHYPRCTKNCMGIRNDISFFRGGRGRSGDSQTEFKWANRRFFPSFVLNRKCHSKNFIQKFCTSSIMTI